MGMIEDDKLETYSDCTLSNAYNTYAGAQNAIMIIRILFCYLYQ